MSQRSIGIRTIGFHLELLGKVIAFAQLEGRPGDFARLRRRLDAIRRQVEADDVRLARFSLEHLLGCLELDRWIQVLAAVLLPEVRQRVLDVLVRSTDVPQDVWQPLDVAGSAAASAANSLREVAAETAIYWAAQAHGRRPPYSRVQQAVSALEDVHELRRPTIPDEDALDAARRCLSAALLAIMPDAARLALVYAVQEDWLACIDGSPVDVVPGAQVDGLGIPHGWHPIWEQIMPRGGEPGSLELWFTPELQHVFETIREQMAEEEAARIAVEEERVRAEAEDALRLAEQQEARRKEEREAAEAQLRAWDEDAPRRVAALRARDIEEAPRIVDEEILQELHEREFQGMQRGLAMKGIEREQRAEMREKKMVEVRKRQEADISGQERTQRDRLVAAIAAFDRPEDPGSEESRGIQVAIATA